MSRHCNHLPFSAAALGTAALFLTMQAAPAFAEALTFEGLDKVRIGMTPAEAAQALGSKLTPMNAEMDSDACWMTQRADGKDSGIWYMVEDGRITRIDIGLDQNSRPATITTEKGIGLGASEQEVFKAYGKALKISPHPYGGPQDHYLLLDNKGAKAALLFEIEGGKVTTFRAGRHPAVDYSEGCS